MAVLIELKSSEKQENMESDATKALKHIEEKNYQNSEGLPNICLFENMVLLPFTLIHMSKGDTWSSIVRIDGKKKLIQG